MASSVLAERLKAILKDIISTYQSGFLSGRSISDCTRLIYDLMFYTQKHKIPGLVFMKGLRLSQVLGLNSVLKLRLLSQLSFVLKPYSQRVT